MKTTVTTVVVAALFAVAATEIYFRLLDERYLALMAMFFLVGALTTGTALRFLARQSPHRRRQGRRQRARRAPGGGEPAAGRRRRPARGPAPPPDAERETGTVKWFDRTKGYGFVRRGDGEEIFVHHRSIRRQNSERASLDDGQTVSFVAVQHERGWQAEDVVSE